MQRSRLVGVLAAITAAVVVVLVGPDLDDEPKPLPARLLVEAPGAGAPPVFTEPGTHAIAELAAPDHGPDDVEVCGVGWVTPQADGAIGDGVLRTPELLGARRRIVESLAADSEPFARAAALWLGGTTESDVDLRRVSVAHAPPDRVVDERAAQSNRDALARLALGTDDPRLYGLAYRHCTPAPYAGWCASLNASRWAQLDAGNAMPWLFILDEATRRKERAAQDEALFRMSRATRFDDRTFAIPGLISAHAGTSDAQAAAALQLSIEAIGLSAAQSAPLQHVSQACRGRPLDDANRRQVCADVAESMTGRTDSVLLRMIGIGIGRSVGWPAERLDALRGEASAWIAAAAEVEAFPESLGCAAVGRLNRRMVRQGVIGELEGLRELLASNGGSTEPFVNAERERRLQAAAGPAASTATP
ncbi:MAG: hypothetical protein ABIO71_07820 [Caldimonas sp.]